MKASSLKINGPKVFWIGPVTTVSHIIDTEWPMFGKDICGHVWICGSGVDRVLDKNETFAMCYELDTNEDLVINAKFGDVYKNSPLQAVKDEQPIIIDVNKFDKFYANPTYTP